jgi:hypothetical protein
MADVTTTEEKNEVIASTTTLLDQLRERIDHLRVQADLGKLDARDEAAKQLTIAQNACLAAEAKLREAGHDLTATAEAVRDGVEQVLRDLKKAIDAAEAAISRG